MADQNRSHPPIILQIKSNEATLLLAGGKGNNLSHLARKGFPVPGGFLITTQAYREYVEFNHLNDRIAVALHNYSSTDPASLETASHIIRAHFQRAELPAKLREVILTAYNDSGVSAFAVRSSATAEDLPGMSFAGQQDTFLNVVGEQNLLSAVIECWSSLWTARAIAYRDRNNVPQMDAALAVVVQEMIASRVSGVIFTANPLTGLRSETVIDAVNGLGEALVSGIVEPDHYVVDRNTQKVLVKKIGIRKFSIRPKRGGGTIFADESEGSINVLDDQKILEISMLGQKIEQSFGFPQDIEFAVADGNLYVLQSRPITSLYPIPPGMTADPLQVMVSFGAVQGMLDPITPLGRDIFKYFVSVGSSLLGIRSTIETQGALVTAGERLWMNMTNILCNSTGRRIAFNVFGVVEPGMKNQLSLFIDDPRLMWTRAGIRPRSLLKLMRFFLPIAGNVILNLISPVSRRQMILRKSEAILASIRMRLSNFNGDPYQKILEWLAAFEDNGADFPRILTLFISGVASGMAPFFWLNMLVKDLPPKGDVAWKDHIFELTRGQAHNPTAVMDLKLWQISKQIGQDQDSQLDFQRSTPSQLANRYLSGKASALIQHKVSDFLDQYGQRGLAEIDIGRTRWREDPTHVFEVLNSYLKITTAEQSPDDVFARSAASSIEALQILCDALATSPRGWLKIRMARFFASRVRELMGLRESPKFFIVRMLGYFRQALLSIGSELQEAGIMSEADDLMYLTFAELKRFTSAKNINWQNLIASRRASYQREQFRRMIPRFILSDGRTFYDGIEASFEGGAALLAGDPVSPGSVEGRVRIVMDPRQAHLQPGEIMVCPGTDPSWTPLFLTAAGLVMEVGGMMTHGAVVAREYGIPAIVGVNQVTSRLKTGQLIRIDGSSGVIKVLEDN